ncbi:Uncharacterised protein [BD1-7 clade bacterium]|uniref:PepSY domain-containing protein n=1 Tax=BD1-7 clade bacterium TaxID=2029982 RepID=A0A5S9NQP0_9GAMM|nr:Uncharacterised protein [BD1-7 clade bacterium]
MPAESAICDRNNGLTAYITLLTSELAAVSDQKRDVLLWIFRKSHTLPTDAIENTQVHHAFGRDYPQVMKRLPVTRLAFNDNNGTRVFVETRTGLVAGMGTQAHGLHSLHFMMLHKYRFLNGLGTTNRDLVITALVLGIVGVCLLGLSMLIRRRVRRGKSGVI